MSTSQSTSSYARDRSSYYNNSSSPSHSHSASASYSVSHNRQSSQSSTAAPQRRNTRRDRSARSSDGTVGTMDTMASRSTAPSELEEQISSKIVVVGDGGCGKTCLLISYSQGIFPEKYVPTVFENYITYPIHERTGKQIELALWDTAGQEEYDRLRPLSYPETNLLFVCFAIDCPNSLDNVMDKWYPEVLHFCPYTPLVLVGLKSDLRNKRSCIDLLKVQGLTPVTEEQGRAVARKMNARYMECSSKEMTGVDEIFRSAIDICVKQKEAEIATRHARENEERRPKTSGADTIMGGAAGIKKKRRCKIL